MSINFAIIGGDIRMIHLAKMIADDENKVLLFGLEKEDILKDTSNIIKCKRFNEVISNSDIIIGPIPFSKNSNEVYMPLSDEKLTITELLSICRNKTIIAGAIKQEIYDIAKEKSINIIDIMENEELAILNALATAEGAIELAISNTDIILHNSKVLILGFGRISKVLAKKLEGLSVKVTCAARKNQDLTWIEAYGYKKTNINCIGENLSEYDIIFNTVPHIILTEEKFRHIKKECVIIELASKPGGIEIDKAEKYGLNVIMGPALPGKVAPVTTAKILKNTVYNILEL